DAAPAEPASPVDFGRDIRPVFEAACFQCHGPEKAEGGLRLDAREGAFKGGDSGPVIIPGKAAESLLVHAVTGTSKAVERMPRKADPLTSAEISRIQAWIDQGADWPDEWVGDLSVVSSHWAFTPPKRPSIPEVQ